MMGRESEYDAAKDEEVHSFECSSLVPECIEVSGLALESNNLHSTEVKLDVAVKL